MELVGITLYLSFLVTLIYGWVINIYWIVEQQVWIWSGESILSIVGVFIVPLGTVMGYVH